MSPTRGAQVAAGVSVLGLLATGYLAVVHLALMRGDLFGGPLCGALGTGFNCHAVAASRLGQGVLGLPLAFWGLLGYLATLTLAVTAWQCPEEAPRALTLLAGAGAAFLVVDAGLLVVMIRQVHALCALCLATYGLNLIVALTAWRALARPWPQVLRELPAAARAVVPWPRTAAAWALWGVVLTGAAGLVTVQATSEFFGRAPGGLRERIRQHVATTPRVAVDTTGDPRLGPEAAPFQIVTFSDFLCPLCQEVARFDEVILAAHAGEVSLVAKQFPLEQTCNPSIQRTVHVGSCQLAAAAACAHAQGKYWAFHDRVFRWGPLYPLGDLEQDAVRAGVNLDAFRQCLAGGQGAALVTRDAAEGARLGLVGTPVTIVNGVLIQGIMTSSQFDELMRVLKESNAATTR